MADLEFQFAAGHVKNSVVSAGRYRFVSIETVACVVAAIEATMIVAGGGFGPLVYGRLAGFGHNVFDGSFGAGVFCSLFFTSVAASSRLYRLPALIQPQRYLRRIIFCCGLTFLSLTAVLFLLKTGSLLSRGAVLAFAAVMLSVCCMTRFGAAGVISKLAAQRSISGRRVFLIGDPEELSSLTPSFLLLQLGLQEVGRASLARAADHPDGYAGSLVGAMKAARESSARELLIASKFDSLDQLSTVEQALRSSPLPARLVPNHVFRSVMGRFGSSQDSNFNLIDLQRAPLSDVEQFMKRAVDVLVAGMALCLLSPILLAAAFAVKFSSSGPVIFRQRRNGFNRHFFQIFKFRTMTVLEDGEVIVQARPGDKRVTAIGQILRRSSIDELPQLWNVLRGDMSLVGPRPHALAHDREYAAMIGDYSLRHHVKPGITGWAQVNGFRGETAHIDQMKARIDLDLWYINNWSFWLDLRILIRTATEVVKQTAY